MASTYSDLKFELIGTGEQSGVWGTTTNDNIGTAIEQALVGLGNPIFTTDANLTISLTNTVALQTARALVLNATSSGSLTATRELVVPTIEKQYIVQNNTTGGQSITVKTTAGTGITITNGRKAHLYVDGVNVIQMFDFVDINGGAIDGTPIGASSASTGAFTTLAASGAVTLSGGTANGVVYANGSKVLTSGSALEFNGTNFGVGTAGNTLNQKSVLYMPGAVAGYFQISNGSLGLAATNGLRLGVTAAGLGELYAPTSLASYIDNSEGMRLTSTGLGIGTSSPAFKLDVSAAKNTTNIKLTSTGLSSADDYGQLSFGDASSIYGAIRLGYNNPSANAASYLAFYNHSGSSLTERMRIDSSGNLLVGTTSGGLKTNRSMGFVVTGACVQYISHSTSDASGDSYVEFGYNGTKIGSITQSGTTAVLYNVTSDQRLKENIVDAPEFGSVIDSIKVRSYDWKTDHTHQRAGFIAQELVTVAPEAVHQPADPDDMMAVDYSKLVPMLVKEIQSLRARVAALESN